MRDCSDASLELMRKLREDGKPSPHVVALTPDAPEAYLVRAYGMGLDGDICRSAGESYLRARMDAMQRRLDPNARRAPKPIAATGGTPLELVGTGNAWRTSRGGFGDAVGKFLSLATIGEVPIPAPELAFGCEVTLSSAAHELELRVALGVAGATARTLAVHLFGDDSQDLEPDMMSELANMCMGTMKTALSADALAFAAGLPKHIPPKLVLRPAVDWKLRDAFAIHADGASVVVQLGLRSRANVVVALSALVEGMVLAKDVYNTRGMLLLTAGTRLSLTMVDKLRDMLPPKQLVEVSGGSS